MIYIYPEKNLRAYPGVERGSQEWEDTYKIRVNVEKSINHFKDSFCIADRKTQNKKTLHADLLLAGFLPLFSQDCELVSQLPIGCIHKKPQQISLLRFSSQVNPCFAGLQGFEP